MRPIALVRSATIVSESRGREHRHRILQDHHPIAAIAPHNGARHAHLGLMLADHTVVAVTKNVARLKTGVRFMDACYARGAVVGELGRDDEGMRTLAQEQPEATVPSDARGADHAWRSRNQLDAREGAGGDARVVHPQGRPVLSSDARALVALDDARTHEHARARQGAVVQRDAIKGELGKMEDAANVLRERVARVEICHWTARRKHASSEVELFAERKAHMETADRIPPLEEALAKSNLELSAARDTVEKQRFRLDELETEMASSQAEIDERGKDYERLMRRFQVRATV